MATSKTLTPTNVTIQIPEFTDQPDQRVNSNCIDKEADAINALNGKFVIENVTSTTINVSDSGVNKISLDVSKTGYTPKGILGVYIDVYGSTEIILNQFFISGSSAYIYFKSSQAKNAATLSVIVLYQK